MNSNAQKAISILAKTDDGDQLTPRDLYLVEAAVNNSLDTSGQAEFDKLYVRVITDRYVDKWLHDIENLTIKHNGYVFWKGSEVDHYSMSFAYSDKGKEAAERLAERCRTLEKLGAEVNSTNVIWRWEQFEEMARKNK